MTETAAGDSRWLTPGWGRWMSRGVRSPARDTLLMSLVPRRAFGRASGLERAGDNAGALLGPLLASALVGLVAFG